MVLETVITTPGGLAVNLVAHAPGGGLIAEGITMSALRGGLVSAQRTGL